MKLIRYYLVGIVALPVLFGYIILTIPLLILDDERVSNGWDRIETLFLKLAGKVS